MYQEFLNLEEVEELARRSGLAKQTIDYYAGAAETKFSARENLAAFQRIKLLPRILRNVSAVDTSTRLFGMDLAFPVIVAPMAMQGMAHEGREVAAARAAANAGIPYTLSTMSTSSQDEVAAAYPGGLLFQLYVIRNRGVVREWVQHAEALGYKALVVTVDAPRLGKREDDERNRFRLPDGCELKILEKLREAQRAERGAAAADGRDNSEGSGLLKLFACEVDDSLTWDFIPWLRTVTRLPVLIKGLLSPEDATIAAHVGVDGIIVSNHGGRQLDYSPSALEVLPAIMRAVGGRVPVLMDGGIRRGTDVLKALAMGASAVLLGRPVLYGLALGGQAGVERVLDLLRSEFQTAMALSGCTRLSEISPSLLILPPDMTGPATCSTCRAQSKL